MKIGTQIYAETTDCADFLSMPLWGTISNENGFSCSDQTDGGTFYCKEAKVQRDKE
jgi:hypothetical protein